MASSREVTPQVAEPELNSAVTPRRRDHGAIFVSYRQLDLRYQIIYLSRRQSLQRHCRRQLQRRNPPQGSHLSPALPHRRSLIPCRNQDRLPRPYLNRWYCRCLRHCCRNLRSRGHLNRWNCHYCYCRRPSSRWSPNPWPPNRYRCCLPLPRWNWHNGRHQRSFRPIQHLRPLLQSFFLCLACRNLPLFFPARYGF